MPGSSAREVEAPIVATTGEYLDRATVRAQKAKPRTPGLPSGQLLIDPFFAACATVAALPSRWVASSENARTRASASGAATASRRAEDPTQGTRPSRTGRSTR